MYVCIYIHTCIYLHTWGGTLRNDTMKPLLEDIKGSLYLAVYMYDNTLNVCLQLLFQLIDYLELLIDSPCGLWHCSCGNTKWKIVTRPTNNADAAAVK